MRRTKRLTIETDNRDKGKVFLLTEMSALRAEKWAARALISLINSGVELTDDEASAGMAGIASVASRGAFRFSGGGMNFAELEPLLDEMLDTVQIVEAKITRGLTEDDVEEIGTLLQLRDEVLKLHVNFSLAERLSGFLRPSPSAA